MNNRKLLLAKVRNGNYAHAGEEEAIELTMNLVPKNPKRSILDLGCGLGGTADYIENHDWGKVVGIDIDQGVLEKAKALYPYIRFELCDVNHVDIYFKNKSFDLFCSFNAFFCFPNQENCLKIITKIANNNAELLIFDYASTHGFFGIGPFTDQSSSSDSGSRRSIMQFSPINIATVDKTLESCRWTLINIVNLNEKYKSWYQSLIEKMEKDKHNLIDLFGKTRFDDLYIGYQKLSDLIIANKIGGCILHAKLM